MDGESWIWIVAVFGSIIAASLGVLALCTLTKQAHRDDQGMYAWHVLLPGRVEEVDPENRIFAPQYVGIYIHGFGTAVADRVKAELEYLTALKDTGYYQHYELRMFNEHWCLYSPRRHVKYFTLNAPYRVTPWLVDGSRTSGCS